MTSPGDEAMNYVDKVLCLLRVVIVAKETANKQHESGMHSV